MNAKKSNLNSGATASKRSARMTRQKRQQIKAKALADYRHGDKLREIAVRYGTSTTAVSLWAKNAKLARRTRGCREKEWPDEEDIKIVRAVKAVVNGSPTLKEIGARFGHRSRAGIHRIFKKWKDWQPAFRYQKGDRLRIDDEDYIVLKPGVFKGLVKNVNTGEKLRMPWKQKIEGVNTYQAVKI